MTKNLSIYFCAVAALMAFTGCSGFDGQRIRQEHAQNYRQKLQQRTEEVFLAETPLTLDDCLRIAAEYNLDIQVAQVRSRVATLDRKVSFSQFLPQVNLNYNYTAWDPQPEMLTGAVSQPMHEKRIREITWQIQMSVFNPSTWFMYAMHKRGEEIAEIAAQYTRQMVALQVTTYYYYCLGLKEIQTVLESRIRAAEALAQQVKDYQADGLVLAWQSEQAQVNVQIQKLQRKRVQNLLEETQGQLLVAMGLSPLSNINFQVSGPLEPPKGTLEDLVTEALLNHPSLRIADRNIAIEKEKVKIALTNFVPSLMGFATRVNTTDAFQKYSSYWMTGLSGVLTVFNGFANIYEYRAAKENVKKVALEREQATLTLILEVFQAYHNYQLTEDAISIAENNSNISGLRYNQVCHQWREGLVDAAELLSVLAEKNQAQMLEINSKFQRQLAIATLLNAMGKTKIDFEESQHDQ